MIFLGLACLVLRVSVVWSSDCKRVRACRRFSFGPVCWSAGPGLYWLVPLGIESDVRTGLRVVTRPIEQQETITRDSVTIRVNAVLWFRVSDPEKAVLTVESYGLAVQQVALTSLRKIIGQHDLDDVLRGRDKINALFRSNVVENVAPWGIAVDLLEMKDVEIPQDMQRVMAMEAEAIREKRARIIKADAELEASKKLAEAAQVMIGNPAALELRRMQMVAEVGAENNSTTVLMVPSEFVHMASSLTTFLQGKSPTAGA
jgi:regulator of protease activity HflC (stomatin/prohibitin superfamily)